MGYQTTLWEVYVWGAIAFSCVNDVDAFSEWHDDTIIYVAIWLIALINIRVPIFQHNCVLGREKSTCVYTMGKNLIRFFPSVCAKYMYMAPKTKLEPEL